MVCGSRSVFYARVAACTSSLDTLANLLEEPAVVNFVVPFGQLVRVDGEGAEAAVDTQTSPESHLALVSGALGSMQLPIPCAALFEEARVLTQLGKDGGDTRPVLTQLGHRVQRIVGLLLLDVLVVVRFCEPFAVGQGLAVYHLMGDRV